ncbi:MAG: porin family protein [Bacteroidales bacterium]|nr:porin family protein [Bacteroidales bacterium]MDY3912248.1 porin family protein [Sodaliphilus sp.]
MLKTIMAAAMAATATVAGAQHFEPNVAIGGHAGYTLSKVSFNPSVPQGMLGGIEAGVAFRYMEEKHFGLIAEVNVQQRGWKEQFDGYSYQFQRRFTYVQVPFLTHIYFGSDRCHVYFNAGPELAYMIANSTSANFDYANFKQIPDFPSANRNTDQFTLPVKNKVDYGISAGLGVELYTRRRHSFSLEGRFYYGLNDVFSSHKKDTFSGSAGMSLMVRLGYYYRIK